MGKTIHQNTIIGEQGAAFIHSIVSRMGYMWNPTSVDAGIDGDIEIRDPTSGEATNCTLRVQSKAVEKDFASETADYVEFYCKPQDVEYWLRGTVPTILILSRPRQNEGYWVSIRDYFATPESRKSNKVRFSKASDRFDESCGEKLRQLAVPRDSGQYSSTPLIQETLYSNLLPVRIIPERIYYAATEITTALPVFARLKEQGVDGLSEFILKDKNIYTVHDLHGPCWESICDQTTIESISFDEWLESTDEVQVKDAVQLLNHCLRQKMRALDFRFSKTDGCYYYHPFLLTKKQRTTVKGIKRESQKSLFDVYYKKSKPSEISICRHGAFRGFFVSYDGDWFLEVTPTYYFTQDGYKPDRWGHEKLKKIKEFEKQKSVFSHMMLWSDILTRSDAGDLFKSEYPFLAFDPLLQFSLGFGIPDEKWNPKLSTELDSDTQMENLFT